MPDRYYSEAPIAGPTVTLGGSEAHHLLHVMRAKPGLAVTLFDGRGGQYAAEVTDCGRAEVELAVGQREDAERELPFRLTLAVPFPKGDRLRWLVEKAVELGVSALVPLATSRSERNRAESSAKLSRCVIEASKQCGRNRLMEISEPVKFDALLDFAASQRILAHPSGDAIANAELTTDTCIAVGPEGGFTEDEVALARDKGWKIVSLGPRILRVETAALALAAKLTS